MNKWVALAICVLWSSTASAAFFNGSKLYELLTHGDSNDRNVARGYIMGAHDALENAEGEPYASFRACPPDGADLTQFEAVVKKWLGDHPDKLHWSASILVNVALSEAFPCAEK